jgi:hypothetical protein
VKKERIYPAGSKYIWFEVCAESGRYPPDTIWELALWLVPVYSMFSGFIWKSYLSYGKIYNQSQDSWQWQSWPNVVRLGNKISCLKNILEENTWTT